jgi:carboxymethylenebutenolidase
MDSRFRENDDAARHLDPRPLDPRPSTILTTSTISLPTPDGACRSFVFHPDGTGPWPAVLMYMDGIGVRPALLEVAERLASYGYYVLLPDLFYRSGPYEPMNARTIFTNPEERKVLMEKFMSLATPANVMDDTRVFLEFLAEQPGVSPGPIAVTGYCMGGRMAMIAAGTFPDAIAACAAFHPGGLATDKPDSPHLLAPKIKARVYIGGAMEDASFPEEQKELLDKALTEAGVSHEIETYPAKHGWVFRDTLTYDAAACERHWESLTQLLGEID